ncbi:hypothetical protein SODALDRAFT_99888 [Sodiomyces alkalinus F11]|uniref:Uncharacterized protein n=1 Tax=Sodiomyces alkalinus (strain CBS 110278 / VKM F-3762 / F11) TaxID=1314773 RepID=A0A3N2Q1E6_SODAK|nr:hypothetical protein SODALDRAFT_99888 [Sodiomyces alkalinus F11]ROT40577.1 hypothetical protein SODALDRAFT_99888 [Sodiomyces alkalinus F11]
MSAWLFREDPTRLSLTAQSIVLHFVLALAHQITSCYALTAHRQDGVRAIREWEVCYDGVRCRSTKIIRQR